ncbi:protein NIM1-INTERACTING 1-like [Pyrus communis]|uniref:protein NIM1-INTERACTING 1-like n=1 Tax=Pyrus communis TaxID=23211 RepID=UPI0035BF170C
MENKKKIGADDQVDIKVWKHQDDQVDEESEEMEIEKFYSLIRNYHDARNRLRFRNATPPPPQQDHSDGHEVLSENSKKRRKTMSEDDDDSAGGGNWVPSFEVGDFAKEVEFRGPSPLLFHSLYSCNDTATTADKKQDDGNNESLDLKLTL